MPLPNATRVFASIRDIKLYVWYDSMVGEKIIISADLHGSSLQGQRLIADFFCILDYHIVELPANADYQLRKLDNAHRLLDSPPLRRFSTGSIPVGDYLIESTVQSGKIAFKPLFTFFSFEEISRRAVKRKRDGEDPSNDSQGFKMRLVHRDEGCAVCLAAGIQNIYRHIEDSNRFEGAHIIDFAYNELWDVRGYKALINDPFTDPANSNDPSASPSTRLKKDPRRINSLENGILLCENHHGDFDKFRIAIHPETHYIFSFHPATANLHGMEVTAPWAHVDPYYPPPHPTFLGLHYVTSVSKAMKGGPDNDELADDDEDEELSELEAVTSERVRIWLDNPLSSMSSGEILPPSFDFTEGNKGNIEILAHGQEVVGI